MVSFQHWVFLLIVIGNLKSRLKTPAPSTLVRWGLQFPVGKIIFSDPNEDSDYLQTKWAG
jgi:uncharacterized membrane protein (DUF485 family)